MNTHLIKLVKLLSVTIFRTPVYMPSLSIVFTPQQSPRLAMKRTHLEAEMESPICVISGKWEHALGKPRNNCLVLFKSVWHHCLLSLKWLQWRLPTTLSMASLGTSSQYTRATISLNSFLCYTGNLVNVVYSNCSFSRSHISRRRIHVDSKNSSRRSDR